MPTKYLNVLDLGCGNGQTMELFLALLEQCFPLHQISLRGLDTNEEMVREYRDLLTNKFPMVTIEVEQRDALKNFPPAEKHSALFTIAAHSLYHVKQNEIEATLIGIKDTLLPTGIALVTLLSKESDFHRIQLEFVQSFEDRTHSYLSVDTATFDTIEAAIVSSTILSGHYEIVPHETFLSLPVNKERFFEFQEWSKHCNPNHPESASFTVVRDLLEFMLHRDWDSLVSIGHLSDFLELIASMIAKNAPDSQGNATLCLPGTTLLIRG